jgi:hypothetical protein
VHPEGLDIGYYNERFPASVCQALPAVYFESHANYNQLCYEPWFYGLFQHFSHLLILQPDAIVVQPDLAQWCNSRFDYIGAPESHTYTYDIRGIPPFDQLPSLAPIVLSGCNGGLSLRRLSAIQNVLFEYKELATFFRSYGVGIGEDIFFSVVGRVAEHFQVANEVTASRFAITDKFNEWMQFNKGQLPFGFHAWYRQEADKQYVLEMLNVLNWQQTAPSLSLS